MSKPQVGISSMWYEGNPCNMHLLNLAEHVKAGVVSQETQAQSNWCAEQSAEVLVEQLAGWPGGGVCSSVGCGCVPALGAAQQLVVIVLWVRHSCAKGGICRWRQQQLTLCPASASRRMCPCMLSLGCCVVTIAAARSKMQAWLVTASTPLVCPMVSPWALTA